MAVDVPRFLHLCQLAEEGSVAKKLDVSGEIIDGCCVTGFCHGRTFFGFTATLRKSSAVNDKASAEWHIVTFQLFGRPGFGIEIKQSCGQVTDAGMTAVMDYLLQTLQPLCVFLWCENPRVQPVYGKSKTHLKKVTLFNVDLHARFDLCWINASHAHGGIVHVKLMKRTVPYDDRTLAAHLLNACFSMLPCQSR